MCLLRQEGKEDGILGKSILRMIIDLPKNVENIIERLKEHGFEGFAVGVRHRLGTKRQVEVNACLVPVKTPPLKSATASLYSDGGQFL